MTPQPTGEPGQATLVHTLETAGVRNRRVLNAFGRVRREQFVPAEYAHAAYADTPIPIGQDQVTSQPSLIGQMVAAADPADDEQVLEIGTGLGFQTAVLGLLARRVWSVERHPDLADRARDNLKAAEAGDVTVVIGDGTQGLPRHAPYQVIIVSATAPEVPAPLADQLAEGGRLVQPISSSDGEYVTVFSKRGGRLVERTTVTPARFVPLLGEHAAPPPAYGT